MKNDEELKKALRFLEERDGFEVFEIEWIKKVTEYVVADSAEAVRKAAEASNQNDLDFGPAEIFVSSALAEHAKKAGAKPPNPDSGVFNGEIIHINEYIAQQIWHMIVDAVGNEMTCEVCGHEDWVSEFDLNPSDRLPKWGYMPIMGCPNCKAFIDWEKLLREKVVDDKTLPLFEGEGKEDGNS
jgi:hypothetical protein